MTTTGNRRGPDATDEALDLELIKQQAARRQKAGWEIHMLVANPPVMLLKQRGSEQRRMSSADNWMQVFATQLGLVADGELTGKVLEELWILTDILG
jgi:hypothetical protein